MVNGDTGDEGRSIGVSEGLGLDWIFHSRGGWKKTGVCGGLP